jgi:hypothetical protein
LSTGPARAAPLTGRVPPLVHAEWTTEWWGGARAAALERTFGSPPSLHALADAAARVDAAAPRRPAGWTTLLRGSSDSDGPTGIPEDALVVLAGQQPCLLGGAALVAHKAATAVALARLLTARWSRPVVPVFLLATEDHDSSEVDHLDFIDPASGRLRRLRCPLHPPHDSFYRCQIDAGCLSAALGALGARADALQRPATHVGPSKGNGAAPQAGMSFDQHVDHLLHACLGHTGLYRVSAHELTGRAAGILDFGLRRQADAQSALASGARELEALRLRASFDPADPRPLVLESRGGRRRRPEPDDREVAARLAADPTAFSPHAALRPLVQAATLPVIAQVCGPSELLYLGQARGLHALASLPAPVLVPRLEATRVEASILSAAGGDLAALDLGGGVSRRRASGAGSAGAADNPGNTRAIDAAGAAGAADGSELLDSQDALAAAARAFAERVQALDPGSASAAHRWLERTLHGVQRLADAPRWRGRMRPDAWQSLRPRGRPQDTVLAWLPDALRHGDPSAWAEHIVSLCRPLDPPAHVLHVLPGSAVDG